MWLSVMRSFVFFWLVASSPSRLYAGEQAVFAGDLWCPYNCDPAATDKGALVEMLTLILAKHDIQFKYEILPWNRAISHSRQGLLDGLIGAGESDAAHSILTEQPWLHAELAILTKTEAQFTWQGLSSLEGKKAVIIDGYEYAKPIPTWIIQNYNHVQSLSGESAFKQAVNLILAGRRDVFFSSRPALSNYLATHELTGMLTITATDFKTPIYMGVSKKSARKQQLVKILNDEFENLRQTEIYRRIIAKYGL